MNHVCVPCCYHYSQNEVRAGSWTPPSYLLGQKEGKNVVAYPKDKPYWFYVTKNMNSNPGDQGWFEYTYDGNPILAQSDYVTSIADCDPSQASCTPCNIAIGKVTRDLLSSVQNQNQN